LGDQAIRSLHTLRDEKGRKKIQIQSLLGVSGAETHLPLKIDEVFIEEGFKSPQWLKESKGGGMKGGGGSKKMNEPSLPTPSPQLYTRI
jgi:hypothetical protein